MDEETGEIGDGFSVDVCKTWEKRFWEQKDSTYTQGAPEDWNCFGQIR